MSEHSLSPDPSEWPRDPFRLLGVSPGVSARDLRKAYLHLIRSYKPEHSPEEFKRIRQAYEAALPFTRAAGTTPGEPEAEPSPPIEGEFKAPALERLKIAPEPDPWDLACRGEPDASYRALATRHREGRAHEDDYLQLYWLLRIVPTVDPSGSAIDWLGLGLQACGANSPRLRELFKRELAGDPALALGEALTSLLGRGTPPSVAVDFAEIRWRAARGLERWGLILADVESLRSWLPEVNEAAWARALIASAGNLAWARGGEARRSADLAKEVERLGTRHQDYSDDLYQLEYLQMVKHGLVRLGGRQGAYAKIHQLLAISWDEPGPEFRARLRAYVLQVARSPVEALRQFDEIQGNAPVVLGRLSGLLGGLEYEHFRFLDRTLLDEVEPELDRFLDAHGWTEYRAFRPSLLKFCLREAVSPGLVARCMAERPSFILTGKSPLAHAINEDWPLRHVYQACERARGGPEDG